MPHSALLELLARLAGGAGRSVLASVGSAGRASLFFARALSALARPPVRAREVIGHVHFIGSRSLGLVALTASFTGVVLVLQAHTALARFGSQRFIGPLVALALIRELAPVLATLMVTARAASAIAAVLGNMRVSEQIDALESMAVDPLHLLVAPRIAAALFSLPVLVGFFALTGIYAGWLFGVAVLRIDGHVYTAGIRDAVEWSDVAGGLLKAVTFAVLLAWIATFRGFYAGGGALGVGRATAQAVVEISALVLALDYALTALLF